MSFNLDSMPGIKVIFCILFSIVYSCKSVPKEESSLSRDLDEVISAVRKKRDSVQVKDASKASIKIEFSQDLVNTQFTLELAEKEGFRPLMILEVGVGGLLEGSFDYLPFQMYRLSSKQGALFFFSDSKDISLEVSTVEGELTIVSSNSFETKLLNDYIQFAENLPQNNESLFAILSYLDGKETGYIHYVNLDFVAQNAADYLSLVKRLRTDFKNLSKYPYAKDFDEVFVISPQVGELAPEIKIPSLNGELDSLSNYRGNYVLIDFWASWCGPCRLQNPRVVELFKKYENQNFKIFGVSLDTDLVKWKSAVDADGLIWYHVCDQKKWSGRAVKAYNVTSIPQVFLIDPNGLVIASGISESELDFKLKEIFD